MPNDLNINDPELEEDEIIEPNPAEEQELDESTTDFFKSLAVSSPTETDPESIDPAGISVNNDELQKILKATKRAKLTHYVPRAPQETHDELMLLRDRLNKK